ncbi:MAG TPA: hypothetical protein DEG43_05010, partial [Acidimicrobiaceae bacterium]|nr:hypothetical protein [Acidimicrobiaceae bacterium]
GEPETASEVGERVKGAKPPWSDHNEWIALPLWSCHWCTPADSAMGAVMEVEVDVFDEQRSDPATASDPGSRAALVMHPAHEM